MRGKEGRRPCVVGVPGITPAYAGKSVINGSEWLSSRDHPRICGEKCNQRVRMVEQPGSPPHMRGKDMGLRASRIAGGITPAYAGKRNRFRFASFYKRDHPRICGEKYLAAGFSSRSRGSPPHMRGKGSFDKMAVSCLGITPAYAGKSVNRYHDYFSSRDHPRICGEKDLSKNFILPELGSPPHMRGKAHFVSALRRFCRITPAYAGKRKSSSDTGPIPEDHPRICGEKVNLEAGVCRVWGSPPHMRGKAKKIP